MSTDLELLKNIILFKDLDRSKLEQIRSLVRLHTYSKNEVILSEGEPGDFACIILEGNVRVFNLSENGRENVLAILGKGDVFGEMSLVDRKCRSATVQAIKKTRVCSVKSGDFRELIKREPEISLSIMETLVSRLRKANARSEYSFSDAGTRLLYALQDLADQYGERHPEGIKIKLNVTHQDLAGLMGSTRETVTRLLKELKRKGLIEVGEDKTIYLKR